MNRFTLSGAIACTLLCAQAWAQHFHPIALWRVVYSESMSSSPGGPSDREYLYQPDFGAYPVMDLTYITQQGVNPPARADASTHHFSELAGNSLRAHAQGSVNAGAILTQQARAFSASTVIMAFTVDQPTAYDLTGNVALDAAGLTVLDSTASAGSYLYRIVEDGAEYVFSEQIEYVDEVRSLTRSGILAPGEYRFSISYFVSVTQNGEGSVDAGGSYDLMFTIPATPGVMVFGSGGLLVVRRRR